jgi:UDP-N-acetyl-2-amino-2-deoxyglucuronate dehydrogenase
MTTAAIIGCGDVSVVHAEALAALPDAELVAVCDPDPGRRAAAAESYGVPGFADHHTLLDRLRPDVVHISTPHHTHAGLAVDAPVAATVAEAEQLVVAAERSSAKIAVCFQNRYNTAVVAMHRLLTSGEVGPVLGAAATVMWHRTPDYYRSRPWRSTWAGSGGGLLMNQAIHTVDLLQWLMGEVTAVSGHAATRALAGVVEVEDTAELVLDHRSGARSVMFGTLANAFDAPVTVDVATEGATLSLRGDLTVTHADGRVETVTERRGVSGGRAYWGLSHQLLIADFYARLGDTEPFWISPREARASLRIVKEVYRQTFPDGQGGSASAPSPMVER